MKLICAKILLVRFDKEKNIGYEEIIDIPFFRLASNGLILC